MSEQVNRSAFALLNPKDDSDADKALERVDASELYALYKKKVDECNKISEALETVAKHYVGTNPSPRYLPSENAVGAMERVALAAIDLAKAITTKPQQSP